MPTTSQGLLIVDDTAPEVFFGLIATLFLSTVMTETNGHGFLLKFWFTVFIPFTGSFTPRLSAGPCTVSISRYIFSTLSFIIQWIYVVVTIEQTIQRNPVIQKGPRFPISFGQVCCAFQIDCYVH